MSDSLTEYGDTFLLLASKGGHHELVEYMLLQGADVDKANEDQLTPLIAASENGNSRVVQLLLNAGANVNAVGGCLGRTALYSACRNDHMEVVNLLLHARADVTIPELC